MTPAEIKSAFQRRRVPLNRGVAALTATQKAKQKCLDIDPYILGIFAEFNGFQEGALDPGSAIRIWSLEEILEAVGEERSRIPFADFLMMSNEYTFDIENADAPVFLDSEEVSENLPEFLRRLLSGDFDF